MKLKLEIEGNTIYEIADQVTKLASEFLIARLQENKNALEKILEDKCPPIKLTTK